MVVAQATVGGGNLFTKLLILPLKPRGLLVTLCRSSSTYVGALKFLLTRLTSGRGLVCEVALPSDDVDVVGESGAFSKLPVERRSPASRSATPSFIAVQRAYHLTCCCFCIAFCSSSTRRFSKFAFVGTKAIFWYSSKLILWYDGTELGTPTFMLI